MALIDDEDSEAMHELRRQASAYWPLAPGEERRLVQRAGLGDRSSEERLLAANLGLIIRLAGERAGRGLSVPDLVQEGSLGLVEAVRTFADAGSTDFASFAEAKVAEQMEAAIAAEEASVRDAHLLVAAATDYERTEILMRRELDRAPTIDEIAEKLEWTVQRTRYVAEVVAEARRRHDEELIAFVDPDAIGPGDGGDDELAEFDA
jgi:RNA polymerase primary sigma factor